MNIEDFFKEWISTRPNLKVEFHEAGIEAMAFADAYHKKQCAINGVVFNEAVDEFKPCGEGDNICNCKDASECGYSCEVELVCDSCGSKDVFYSTNIGNYCLACRDF